MKKSKKFNIELGPMEWEKKIWEYFEVTPQKEWTFGSLYLFLGIGATKFKELGKKTSYKDGADYVRARMSDQYERRLSTNNSTGAIFALKNMGWSDTADLNITSETKVRVEDLLKGGKMRAK